MFAIYICIFFGSIGFALYFSYISTNRSIPIAKPIAGVSAPPNSFTNPSYLPPARTVYPSSLEINSNTVLV